MRFYGRDDELVAGVAEYLREGLDQGERVVMVGTEQHCQALQGALEGLGVDVVRARAEGRFTVLDAERSLADFMVDGRPDRERFMDTIGHAVRTAGSDGRDVRVFGEMVALLWDQGDVNGAIDLEALWNELAEQQHFLLTCGYPTTALDVAELGDVSRVCGLHTDVVAPVSYRAGTQPPETALVQKSEIFVPAPEAVSAARRFVADLLRNLGMDDLVDDAMLVTSEMATNAIQHGCSAFRVHVEPAGGVVRISIEDAAAAHAERRAAADSDLSGRGVAIVEALARRWGSERLADGKAVWAELNATDPPA